MNTFKFTVRIHVLIGLESRSFEIKAKTLESAEKKLSQIMGNRDYDVIDELTMKNGKMLKKD